MPVVFDNPSVWKASNIALVTLCGEDRISFLHNFCSNDIKRLALHTTVEAYIPNIKGKCLGFVIVYQGSDELILVTNDYKIEELVAHLNRYIITEDVEINLELSPPCSLVTGEGIREWLQREQPTGTLIANNWFEQDSYWLLSDLSDLSREQQTSLTSLSDQQVHAARIHNGTPLYGLDITEDNLAQEVNRDQQAISFTKGCYLGQEPIARIDALGNVHWYLVRVDNQIVNADPNSTLTLEGQPIARIRSTSPESGLALAYVKRGYHEPQSTLETDQGVLKVI